MLGRYRTYRYIDYATELNIGIDLDFELMTVGQIDVQYGVDVDDCPYLYTQGRTFIRFDEDKWLVADRAIHPDELNHMLIKSGDVCKDVANLSAVLIDCVDPKVAEYRSITNMELSLNNEPDLLKTVHTVVSFNEGSTMVRNIFVSVHTYDIYKHGYLELMPVVDFA